MYLILLSNGLYFTADTLQEVKDFVKVIQKDYTAKIFKCTGLKQYEEKELKEK